MKNKNNRMLVCSGAIVITVGLTILSSTYIVTGLVDNVEISSQNETTLVSKSS